MYNSYMTIKCLNLLHQLVYHSDNVINWQIIYRNAEIMNNINPF